jgi:hypothetical protein
VVAVAGVAVAGVAVAVAGVTVTGVAVGRVTVRWGLAVVLVAVAAITLVRTGWRSERHGDDECGQDDDDPARERASANPHDSSSVDGGMGVVPIDGMGATRGAVARVAIP